MASELIRLYTNNAELRQSQQKLTSLAVANANTGSKGKPPKASGNHTNKSKSKNAVNGRNLARRTTSSQ